MWRWPALSTRIGMLPSRVTCRSPAVEMMRGWRHTQPIRDGGLTEHGGSPLPVVSQKAENITTLP